MSLTESKSKDLLDKKFDKLYSKHKDEWKEITSNAYKAAKDHICDGKTPRQDDVLKMLLPMLEPNELLRKHQEQEHARFKKYREAFAEFLIDEHYRDMEAVFSVTGANS